MSGILPIRTTMEDVDILCRYLLTKPTGATAAEARAVVDSSVLDGRKVNAMKFWGFIEDNAGKLRITDKGRLFAKDGGAKRAEASRATLVAIQPYFAIVERANHNAELVVAATEVAAHWHQHFGGSPLVSSNDKILNDQAVCFFQLAEAADLGALVIGRRGQPTRFEFHESNINALVTNGAAFTPMEPEHDNSDEAQTNNQPISPTSEKTGNETSSLANVDTSGNRVFITHGRNKKILDQVKELVIYGKFEPVIAQERETSAKPVPDKVMDEMRACQAAVIHVGVDRVLYDEKQQSVAQINGNVLIEIGAAMALYGRNFILLVEQGVDLPSNLQGLYECRYSGDELNMEATMKLLKAFNEFR